ncbi:XRE family transcriptional regulator [bacterium]|nr:MAG: XRE family transcriptional regulator [bacterium]
MEPHIAARVRSGRLARGISQLQLAEQAGVHRTVVARAETDGNCRPSSLRKIALALGVTLTWIRRPFLSPKPWRLDKADDTLWVASNPSFVRRRGLTSREALQNAAERDRLGSLGLANAFVRVLNNDLPGGRLHALIVESYRREQDPIAFPGQMLLYVIRGHIRLTVGEDVLDMDPGDTVSFWADQPNLYEPVDGPATVLEIFIDLSDEEIATRDLF